MGVVFMTDWVVAREGWLVEISVVKIWSHRNIFSQDEEEVRRRRRRRYTDLGQFTCHTFCFEPQISDHINTRDT